MSEKESRLSVAEAFITAKNLHIPTIFQFSNKGLTILDDRSSSLSHGDYYFRDYGISPNNFYMEINPNGKNENEIINVKSIVKVEGGGERFSFMFRPGHTVDMFTDMILLENRVKEINGFVSRYPIKNVNTWVTLVKNNKFKSVSPKCLWDVAAQEVLKLENGIFYVYNKTTFGDTWKPLTIAGRHFDDGVYFPIYLKNGCSDESVSKIQPYWLSEGNYII